MTDISSYETLQTLSRLSYLAAIVIGLIALILFINASGGMKGISEKLGIRRKKVEPVQQETVPASVKPVGEYHIKKDLSEEPEPEEDIPEEKEEDKLVSEEPGISETMPLEPELTETMPLEPDLAETMPLDDHGSDDTSLLSKPISENKFKITRKTIITHNKEGQK